MSEPESALGLELSVVITSRGSLGDCAFKGGLAFRLLGAYLVNGKQNVVYGPGPHELKGGGGENVFSYLQVGTTKKWTTTPPRGRIYVIF